MWCPMVWPSIAELKFVYFKFTGAVSSLNRSNELEFRFGGMSKSTTAL